MIDNSNIVIILITATFYFREIFKILLLWYYIRCQVSGSLDHLKHIVKASTSVLGVMLLEIYT